MKNVYLAVAGVAGLGLGALGGAAIAQSTIEPEVVTETVKTEVEVTPQACEMALDAAYDVFDAFRDLWSNVEPVVDAPLSIDARTRLDDEARRFNENMPTLIDDWQMFASECDPRYDY